MRVDSQEIREYSQKAYDLIVKATKEKGILKRGRYMDILADNFPPELNDDDLDDIMLYLEHISRKIKTTDDNFCILL